MVCNAEVKGVMRFRGLASGDDPTEYLYNRWPSLQKAALFSPRKMAAFCREGHLDKSCLVSVFPVPSFFDKPSKKLSTVK